MSKQAVVDETEASSRHERLDDLPRLALILRDAILAARSPVILTHANPDADAVASALAMAAVCEHLGVSPVLVAAGDAALPTNLGFIRGADRLTHLDDAFIALSDLVIYVDCADISRLGPLFDRATDDLTRQRASINVDHHVTNTRFATFNIVLPHAAATAEILTGICDALELDLGPDEATTLLAGIYGDTLGLRTPSTTPTTLRFAARLLEEGADVDIIVDALFRLKPYSTVCLWAEALQRTQWRDSLIWTQIDPDILGRAEADRAEAEGIVNFLAGTIGARAAALLYEESWGWRVSMRSISDEVNVAEILKPHNGGGHPRAAGARLEPGEDARDRFLDDIAARLGPRIDRPFNGAGLDEPV